MSPMNRFCRAASRAKARLRTAGSVCALLLCLVFENGDLQPAGFSKEYVPSADFARLFEAYELYLEGNQASLEKSGLIIDKLIESDKARPADICMHIWLEHAIHWTANYGQPVSKEKLEAQLKRALASLEKEPGNYFVHSVVADLYLRLGNANKALYEARKAYELNKQDLTNPLILAQSASGSATDYFNVSTERGHYFELASQLTIYSSWVALDMGHIYMMNKRYKKAAVYYDRAAEIFKDFAPVEYYRGLARVQFDRQAGRKIWQNWLKVQKKQSAFYKKHAPFVKEQLEVLGQLAPEPPSAIEKEPATEPSGPGKAVDKKEKAAEKEAPALEEAPPTKDEQAPAADKPAEDVSPAGPPAKAP